LIKTDVKHFWRLINEADSNIMSSAYAMNQRTHAQDGSREAVQNVQIGVVWGTKGSLKVIGNATIR